MIATLLTAAVVGAVAVMMVTSARHTLTTDRPEAARVLRAVEPWMVAAAPAVLGAVGATWWALAQIPGLNWGWWRLLTGGTGGALGGGTSQGGWIAVVAFGVLAAFAIAIPREARGEEELFRNGNQARSRRQRAGRALGFGLMHCLVGVPIAAGIALAVSGVYYDAVYQRAFRRAEDKHQWLRDSPDPPGVTMTGVELARRLAERDATDSAAAAHAVYNYWVLGIAAALLGVLLVTAAA